MKGKILMEKNSNKLVDLSALSHYKLLEDAYNATQYAAAGSVPTKTSDLTNDSNFITSSALSGYVASSATSTIFFQDTTPSTSSDGDIWIDTSQDAIPSANGEEF